LNAVIRTIFVLLLVAAAALAITSIKHVGEDEVWLVGRDSESRELGSGFKILRPFASVRKYHLESTYRLAGPDRLEVPLPKGRRAGLDCAIEVRLDRGAVKSLDRQYGGEMLEKLVRPLAVREVSRELSQFADIDRVVLDSVSSGLEVGLNRALKPAGVTVTSVTLSNLIIQSSLPAGLTRVDGLKVFILGLDAFDWKIVDLVSRTRKLDNIDRVRREGTWGDLRSMEPLVSPLIWTTMATGFTPDVHGITDFLVTDPKTGDEIPVTSTMRRVPALWNIATLYGLRSGVVGWLATYPAEEIDGFVVSDRAAYHMFDPSWLEGDTAGPREGLTYPPGLLAEIQPLLVEPAQVTGDIAAYVHGPIGKVKESFDPDDPVSNLRLMIAGFRTYENIVNRLYPQLRPDLMAVYFEFTDSACHLFMPYMPPAMPGLSAADQKRYGDGVAVAYAEADRLLGEVLGMIDDETILLIISDHGFKSGDIRPMTDSRIGHGQAVAWHRINGAVALYGPHVKPGHRIVDASVIDVAPTALYMLGLPVDEDTNGKVLLDAFDDDWVASHPVRRTETYRSLFPERDIAVGASSADQALRDKLVSLGYVAGGNASLVNMANFYQRNGRYAEAIEIWKQLIQADPGDLGARIGMSNAYLEMGRPDSAVAGLADVLRIDPRNAGALSSRATIYVRRGMGQEALRAAEDALKVDPNNADFHLDRALSLDLLGRTQDAIAEYKQAVRLAPDMAEAYANLAQAYLVTGQTADALVEANKALDLGANKPEVHYTLGQALDANGRREEALSHFMTSLKLDTSFVGAYIGAANVLLAQGKRDSAIAVCDRGLATASQYKQYLHSTKGMALLALGDSKAATSEFQQALEADSKFLPARLNLARVYLDQGNTGQARKELERVLAVDPSNGEALAMLQRIGR
jgi:tetratricopeptide (TPR) repeat protein/predicted AlkP superfamily phosphohydrolase/phosphomutase